MIHKTRDEANVVFREARTTAYETFAPEKTGYCCQHTFDKYDEVATIARPPVEPVSRKPVADTTGYIVCMYRVFKGDDGQKFERNWLYWTGTFPKYTCTMHIRSINCKIHDFLSFRSSNALQEPSKRCWSSKNHITQNHEH